MFILMLAMHYMAGICGFLKVKAETLFCGCTVTRSRLVVVWLTWKGCLMSADSKVLVLLVVYKCRRPCVEMNVYGQNLMNEHKWICCLKCLPLSYLLHLPLIHLNSSGLFFIATQHVVFRYQLQEFFLIFYLFQNSALILLVCISPITLKAYCMS